MRLSKESSLPLFCAQPLRPSALPETPLLSFEVIHSRQGAKFAKENRKGKDTTQEPLFLLGSRKGCAQNGKLNPLDNVMADKWHGPRQTKEV
jgi:hypothetical protein